MSDEPSPEEQKRLDAESKAKEDAEQAALPYKWTQTIKDVDVTFQVDGKYKGRDFDIKITKTHLKVAIKGQDPIIDVCIPIATQRKKKKSCPSPPTTTRNSLLRRDRF